MLLASLMEPSFGLIFWMTLSFLVVLFIMAKFAWKPILNGLQEREATIADSLNEAKKAREEIAAIRLSAAIGRVGLEPVFAIAFVIRSYITM